MEYYKRARLTHKFFMLNIDPIKKGLIDDREYFTEELVCQIVDDYKELENTKIKSRIIYDTIMETNDELQPHVLKSNLYFNKNLRINITKFIEENINENNYYSDFIKKIFTLDEESLILLILQVQVSLL